MKNFFYGVAIQCARARKERSNVHEFFIQIQNLIFSFQYFWFPLRRLRMSYKCRNLSYHYNSLNPRTS